MRKLFLCISMSVSLSAFSQQPKQDSLVLQITMDTTTFKIVVQLIQEAIPSQSATGKLLLQNILAPFYQDIKLVPREKLVTPIKK